MSGRDNPENTAQAAKGKAKRADGKAARNPYAQAEAAQKKANLKQAVEKAEGHRQEVTDGLKRRT